MKLKTKIKICGICQTKIANQLINYPIDAIGLVFYDKSPRFVDIKLANAIIEVLPPFVNRVGLFVNARPDFITNVLAEVALDTLQFHGDETQKQCERYQLPFIKAVRVDNSTNLDKVAKHYHQASALLLDTRHSNKYGGTGAVFDWSLIPTKLALPIILAGGLTADNVAKAISQVGPYAVDVSSGVETSLGIKDLTKIEQFINKVYGV